MHTEILPARLQLQETALLSFPAQMVFVIQRGDCTHFAPCHASDPEYGRLVLEAAAMGVRVIALRCSLEGDPVHGRGVVRYIGPAEVRLRHGLS